MNKKGIAILDVLVALVVVTIVGVLIGKYIIGILETNKEIELKTRFTQMSTYINSAIQKIDNLKSYTLTPRGVISLKPTNSLSELDSGNLKSFYDNDDIIYFNYEKALYGCYNLTDCSNVKENLPYGEGVQDSNKELFFDINNFTIYNFNKEDYPNKLEKQEAFFQIPTQLVSRYGDIPLFFTIQRYGYYEGYLYPYKIFSFIDLGPFLFKKLKSFLKRTDVSEIDKKKVMAFLFPVTDNGVTVTKVISFQKIKEDSPDFYNLLEKLFGNNPDKVFAENKKYIRLKIFNTMQNVQSIVKNTVDELTTIKRNVEDWAVIQARIAAYDSLNGNNMDKDYFITCTYDGCDLGNGYSVDKTRTLKPNLPDDAKICNSDEDTCPDTDVDELELNNGFFVCKENSILTSSKHFRNYYCSNTPPSVISSDCIDDISIYQTQDEYNYGGNDDIEITNVARLDVPTNNGKCLLGEAARKLLSSTNFTLNPLNIPVYFSNSNVINITNNDTNLLNNDNSSNENIYTIGLNIPIVNAVNNPPYTAEILTIFPWFVGGFEKFGYTYCDVYSNSNVVNEVDGTQEIGNGFGVIAMPIFAHVF